jgi:hypothetical protein
MKRLFTILALCFGILMSTNSFAVVGVPANSQQETVTQKSPSITIEDIKTLSAKEIEEKVGQKLNWKQKLAIKLTKNKLAKADKAEDKPAEISGGFGIGLLLGFVLGLIGVLLAYVVFKDKQTIKGSWIGLVAVVALILILTLVAAASVV